MRFVLFFLLVALSPLDGIEQTLDEYVAQAASENAGIRAAFEHWQATIAKVSYANSLPDPKITYGHFIRSVETRVGPQKFRLGVAQMIPWLGKLSSRKDVASQQAVLAEKELALAYVNLRLALSEAFLDHLYLAKATAIQKDNIDLASLLEQTAQSRVRVGGSGADTIQAQMELNRLEYELMTLQDKGQIVAARINAILNRPTESSVQLPSDIEQYVKLPEQDLSRLTAADLEAVNPRMKIIGAQRKIQESRRKLVHRNRYPDATVGVDWVKTDRALMTTPSSGKDPVVAFVSINLPVWLGTYRSQEREVEAQIEGVLQVYQQESFRLQAEQERLLYDFSDAKRRIELFGDLLVPQAEQALSILTEAYKTGRSDFERLQSAEIALLKLQLKLERARVDLGITVARHQALIGEA
jgi:cobalt-zinc-cadmium efflux system outer membrane protein